MIRLLSRILFIIILWIPIQVVAQVDDVNINSNNDIEPEDPYAYLHDNEVYVDSLKSWMSQNDNDSIRALYLADLAYYSAYSSVSQSEKYAEEALRLADSLKNPYLHIYALQSKANAYTIQGLYLNALQVNQEALVFEEENPFSDLKVLLVNNIGDSYMELNDYQNAYSYFQTALNMSREMKDSLSETIAMFNIGRVYKVQKNYTKALEYIYSSKLLSEKIEDTEGAAYSDFELGLISHLQGEFDQAVKFLESSIAISDGIGIEELTAKSYVKIGNIEEERNNFILALEYYYKALKINDKIKNQKGTAEADLGIGKLQIKMNAMENASSSLYNGLSIALALKDKELESKFYEALSMFYEKRKDYDQSLSYYKLFKINADSVFNFETNMHVALMETQFDSEKKDKEIAQFQEQKASQDAILVRKQAQNTMLFGGLILVVVVSIGLYITLRNNRRVNHQLRVQKQEIETKNVQLDKLNHVKDKFFSIISHDLKSPFQSLSGILELMSINALSDKEIKTLFKELKIKFDGTNDLLENLLNWAKMQMKETSFKPEKLKLEEAINDELKSIKNYKVKEIELENKVTSLGNVYADINMLRLVIRNLVNNAIKFTKQKGRIEILSEDLGDQVCVSIKDNGVGISSENKNKIFSGENSFTTLGTDLEKGTGLGLSLCKEFIELNGGKIWVESEEGKGSTFKFTLQKAG